MDTPAIITQKMLYEKLMEISKDIEFLKQRDIENNIEELSLYKASKRIKKNPEFLKAEADLGRLKAIITERDNKKVYRFRLCDLNEWQKKRLQQSYDLMQTSEIKGKAEAPEMSTDQWAKNYVSEFHKTNKKGGRDVASN